MAYMLPYQYRHIVEMFVEGNIGDRFERISKLLVRFYEKEAPIITTVDVYLKKFVETRIGDMDSDELKVYFRKDLEDAEKSLQTYNFTYNLIGHQMAMMSSNINLPDFLRLSGISREEISGFQKDVAMYWDETYKPLLERIGTIHSDLLELKKVLEEEISILKKMPETSFIYGFKYYEGFDSLFSKEKELFWQIVKESSVEKKELNKVDKLAKAARKKLKQEINAHLRILKSGVKEDIIDSETKLQKAMAVCAFMVKALDIYFNYKKMIFDVLKRKFLRKLINKAKEKKRKDFLNKLAKVAKDITENSLVELAKAA